MNCLFWTQILRLNFKEKCWKVDVATFTAHLSVTIKCLTRYKQKVVLAAMHTNHTSLLKNQSATNISLKCVSSQISGVR